MKSSKVCVQCQFMFGGRGKDTQMYVATPVLFVCVHGCAGLCVSVCVSLCSIRQYACSVGQCRVLPKTNEL